VIDFDSTGLRRGKEREGNQPMNFDSSPAPRAVVQTNLKIPAANAARRENVPGFRINRSAASPLHAPEVADGVGVLIPDDWLPRFHTSWYACQ
jgi:hypothetical protein